VQLGSGKMSLSVVPLDGAEVTWTNGPPSRN
jgi:CreA protein